MEQETRLSEEEINQAIKGLEEAGTVREKPHDPLVDLNKRNTTVEIVRPETIPTTPDVLPTNEQVDELLEAHGMAPVEDGHVVLDSEIQEIADGEHNN